MNTPAARASQLPPPPEAFHLRDATWHQASIDQTLRHWDGRSDLWIFGYGSLIWRPEFDHLEARRARIHGYHRALCLWSRINRGTPERPGLVFGLDLGGSCEGTVYRIAGDRVPDILGPLWQREMPSASYIPRWLNCHTTSGAVTGLVFTMDRRDEGYVKGLSTEEIVAIVRQGRGRYGHCTEYVLQTADALDAAGITDRRLRAIARALRRPI
ncbi:gamma-glutamylcyclotransferase [Castellaniella denitrificans]|uniref:gamma-glutamylcyclotransferase n=1 Tax=Castellaniella denitrificans TaxID=56119 RepID=UPI0038B29EC7